LVVDEGFRERETGMRYLYVELYDLVDSALGE